MKTIRQALRQRARRILAAVFAEIALASRRRAARRAVSNPPRVRRRRVEAHPWPRARG